MKTGTQSNDATYLVISGLTFISDLVDAAAAKGYYNLIIDDERMTPDIAQILRVNYGYTVSIHTNDTISPKYYINWYLPTPSVTPTLTPSVTPTITPTVTITPTLTVTPSVTPTITVSITPSLTPTPTHTPSI